MGFRFTRKRRGGAFQAKGSYGCVFRKPPLKCVNEATRRNNSFISKLSSSNVAIEEYEQSSIIRHFDPHMQYFVTADKLCKFNGTNIRPENEFAKCTLKEIQNAQTSGNYKNTSLVLYKNAGIDLQKIILSVDDYIPFYVSLVNIFNALKFIHSKGIIHHDLKSDNLIAQKNPDGSFTSRLIDVGFTCPLKPIEGPHNSDLNNIQEIFSEDCVFSHFKKKARSYGPFYEFMFYYPGKDTTPRLQKYTENQREYLSDYNAWVNAIAKYLGSDDPFKGEDGKPRYMYEDVMDALVEIWDDNINKYFRTTNVDPDFILRLTSAADIFSWGLVLAKLQKRYVNHTVERKAGVLKTFVPRSTKLKNAGAPEIWVAVEDLGRFGVSAGQASWHLAVAERISIPLHVLMTNMSTLDPRRAININEALGLYTAILDAVRELYTPQKVYDGLKAIDEYPDLARPAGAVASTPAAAAAAAAATNSSSSTKAAVAKSSSKPTSTRRLKLDEAQKRALGRKKRAIERAKEEADEDLDDAKKALSKVKTKYRELEDKLDEAEREKMDTKVIDKFVKALANYDELIRAREAKVIEVTEEGRRAVEAAEADYVAFRAGLPRL